VPFHLSAVGPPQGEYLAVSPAWMTAKQYAPLSLLALWDAHEQAPLYLVTSLADLDEAVAQYKKRAHIETFFSDQKSRGFHIHKSHLSEPSRLSRLLLASCLAYVWIVYLGVCALQHDWMKLLHRTARCDLSLFRRGLRLLSRCLKENLSIPEGFVVPAGLPITLVRRFHKLAA
jgi:hypothetical protein